MTNREMLDFYCATAEEREKWNRCGSGNLLNAVKPLYGFGIDFLRKSSKLSGQNIVNMVLRESAVFVTDYGCSK
jgi:hypothetical protein